MFALLRSRSLSSRPPIRTTSPALPFARYSRTDLSPFVAPDTTTFTFSSAGGDESDAFVAAVCAAAETIEDDFSGNEDEVEDEEEEEREVVVDHAGDPDSDGEYFVA